MAAKTQSQSQSPSLSQTSDSLSMVSSSTTAYTPTFVMHAKPLPEYISTASASQLATEVADICADQEELESWRRSGRAAVTEGAVALINAFLDRQLFDMINTARTTSLAVLKPAVSEVLRKNLAKDAIAFAQDNLEDLLALHTDGEADEQARPSSRSSAKWNVEFTWKRSRLRVMMRSEKSEFDIDDDERCVHEESLSTTFSETAGVISLTSEIFLAGIVDFLGDMLLSRATQCAVLRALKQASTATATPPSTGDAGETGHILVQEMDVEKAALSSALDRQWRSWRKSLRSPSRRGSLPFHSAASSPVMARRGSLFDRFPDRPENNYPEHVLASNIPLPMTERDVDEIEVPGLARDPDEPDSQPDMATPKSSRPQSQGYFAHKQLQATQNAHKSRPVSVPTPLATPFVGAPGAWPDTPAPEADTRQQQDQSFDDEPRTASTNQEDSASFEDSPGERGRKTSQPESPDAETSSLKSVNRPKRLGIYGPASKRYTQANISREGLESPQNPEPPFSPEEFLASRNLGASSSTNLTPTSAASSFTTAARAADADSTNDDESFDESKDRVPIGTAVSSPGFARATMSSPITQTVIRRVPSNASLRSPTSPISPISPVRKQRVSADFMNLRSGSKGADSASLTNSKRGSLRQVSSGRDSVDERKKPLKSVEQDFDMLLQSEETVKFTLTPDSVRDIPDRPYSPHMRLQKQTLFRNASKENLYSKKDSDSQSIRSNHSKTWSLGGSKDKKESTPPPEAKRKTSVSRPVPQNMDAPAREPVMQTDSTRDFSDYIRSTGPDKEPNTVVPLLASRSMSSLRATAAVQAAAASNAPAVPSVPKPAGGKYIPRSPLGPIPKRNLLAREATGSSNNNDDLIDFIRSGPPAAGGARARVPNHIAPFADPDDFYDGPNMNGVADLPGSPLSTYTRPLTSSTTNSRTGLTPNVPTGSGNSSQLSPLPGQTARMPSPLTMPNNSKPDLSQDTGKKRFRVKDPYAIPNSDDDDDDEDDEEDVLGALRIQQNGVASSPSISTGFTQAQAQGGAEKRRANSVGSLHSSIGRPSPGLSGGRIPNLSPNPGYEPSIRSMRSTTSTTAVRPAHITSQISSGGSLPRSYKPKFEVREAGSPKTRLDPFHKTETDDLADFFKSSGPPEPPVRRDVDSAPTPTVSGRGQKPEKKKSVKFWQRSKPAANSTYLDMP